MLIAFSPAGKMEACFGDPNGPASLLKSRVLPPLWHGVRWTFAVQEVVGVSVIEARPYSEPLPKAEVVLLDLLLPPDWAPERWV
ncbi:hypothetical protein ACPOL_4746 [Acidisarcina polymorpha]|uniref:Uncharacterized protein n=2 Tax=Acidisarcina polymorpha TaxID=2211140 RepID=A0A2Z5G5I0_9BACT|nr:hypothetical protein ACPOL_4746 [Acidisarcina polymorpha]